MVFDDPRAGVAVTIDVQSLQITDLERERFRYFVQMRGVAVVRVAGREVGRLPGFFETYVE
jgi:hypothetical protein